MTDELGAVLFEIINYGGDAKGLAYEAIDAAENEIGRASCRERV